MRRTRILTHSLAALTLAVSTALPGVATAAELPKLPAPGIPAPQLQVPADVRKELDRIEEDAYNALPKELQNNPIFAGSSRPQAPGSKDKKKPAAKDNKHGAEKHHKSNQHSQSVADATCSNCVAVTYDDGPGELTAQVLDTLKAKDAHASFMVLAPKAYAHPELLRRMKAEGHTVGNHTATHPELDKLPAGQVDGEIKAGAAAIKAATGESPRWLRPPYGATNNTVYKAAQANGQAQALWSVDTLDWKDLNTDHVCRAAVDGAQPGAIILMHDIHPTTVAATDCVIDGLRAKGLEPVSLDRLIPNPEAGKQYLTR
ncbi:polysaccharide deacetylase family protein [Corynebacterium minutissimum]|uniref:Polysaccharide deacetylase n=1 Tax=Corynebacterium minutissimum TaxID=38301 RepID=A0A376CRF3_9CORY|nr:polysaccharide deacetylase family protein [Corynebacterium minutissimum]QRP62067.1 polysaccharide deacetylase family protein [Corynebacterium minutissimum]STC73352.1 polysaccharide deacetylase [Corynebacterium minutissimum]